ncbi:MAG: hypothetical protein QOH47_1097 [Sphingomonadales bacterium]|nr:hypothetical protein [Sphingomonadales bacterium]
MAGRVTTSMRILKRLLVGPTLAAGSVRAAGAVAAIALVGAATGPGVAQPAPQSVWLDQNWTPAVRAAYHHQSQGTLTVPVPRIWFLALQQPEISPSAGRFSDPAFLERFGFIPSPRSAGNPDGLPIGFAPTTGPDPRNNQELDRIGFTCAACHTGRIDVGRTSILVDGAPALIDLGDFGAKLGLALGMTDLSLTRFPRFASEVERLLGHPVDRAQLHRELHALVRRGLGAVLQDLGSHGVKEGFGRLDALNRIGNTVFADGMNLPQNRATITAPVAFPHIWDTPWFAWVQYNGSIERPMVRNAGEAMGVSAPVNYHDGPTPRFTSTIPVGALGDNLEAMLAGPGQPNATTGFTGLRSPAWPENILPPIDRPLAARGAALYGRHCQGCHLPAPNTPEFWTSSKWTPANAAGERYLDLNMIPIAHIGTDSAQAAGMRARTVLASRDLGLVNAIGPDTGNTLLRYEFGDALGQVVAKVVTQWYDSHNISPAERDRLNGNRPNGIRAPLAYKARPLNGIWATPPYLHNGSVPTLWALLSPYAERPTQFSLGNRQFDAVRVGYLDGGPFRLDTRIAGNRNTGHLFETAAAGASPRPGTIGPTLSRDERRALLEYLKTL